MKGARRACCRRFPLARQRLPGTTYLPRRKTGLAANRKSPGRELEYLKWFHNSEAINSRAFTNEAEETYARAYAIPGALRAGFEYYRAFTSDVKANQEFAKHKLTMPVLGIGGSGSFGPIIGDHLRHVASDVQAVNVEGAGHWVAEEKPAAVTDALSIPPARRGMFDKKP